MPSKKPKQEAVKLPANKKPAATPPNKAPQSDAGSLYNAAEHGKQLIYLGVLLQNPNVLIRDLTAAAFDCGLAIQFKLVKNT